MITMNNTVTITNEPAADMNAGMNAMMFGHNDTKHALVMGIANRDSIAYGCALALKLAGYDITMTYQNAKTRQYTQAIADALEANFIECDVNNEIGLSHIAPINVVIHSVASAPLADLHGDVIDCSESGFSSTMHVSCYSLIKLVKAIKDKLRPGASIWTMSYIGAERAVQNYGIMGVAKAALESTVRYLAVELGQRNVRVNAVSVGPIKTRAASGINKFDDLLEMASATEPLRERLDVHNVGRTVCALAQHGVNITGQTIYVDNGYSCVG